MPGSKPYTLTYVQQHPLARMLPLRRDQAQTYRMGERIPPSALDGHAPMWETVELQLDALDTLQARVNVQRDFTWLAMGAISGALPTKGGFRIQIYDIKKRYRFADRSINFANFAGTVHDPLANPIEAAAPAVFFLREPYRFEIPDSHVLIQIQNFEQVANVVTVLLYGQVLRFNAPGITFPGGRVTGWDWASSIQRYYSEQGGRG